MPSKDVIQIKQSKPRKISNAQLVRNSKAYTKIQALADETLFYIQNFIMARAKNPTGNLIQNLDVTVRETEKGLIFAIGNIDKLNKNAPYWYVLNYGRTITGAEYGPKVPFNYIEAGLSFLKSRMPKTTSKQRGFTRNTLPDTT